MFKTVVAMSCVLGLTVPTLAGEVGGSLGNIASVPKGISASGIEEQIEDLQSGRVVALDDISISVAPTNYTSIVQDSDGFVYIYTEQDGSMPYVIIGYYDMDSTGFVDKFTDYMSGVYSDLDTDMLQEGLNINGKTFDKVVYNYTVDAGYSVRDTRLFTGLNGRTYMFGAKEVPDLGYSVGDNFLETVAGSFEMLAGGDGDYQYHVDSTRSIKEPYEGDVSAVDSYTETEDSTLQNIGGSGSEDTLTTIQPETTAPSNGLVFSESKAPYTGVWCPFADGFQLYLPNTWVVFDTPASEKPGGCIYQAGDASATTDDTAPYMAVNCVDVSQYNYTTLEDIKADLVASGYIVDDITTVNGIGCISYRHGTVDLGGLMFYGPKDPDLAFAVVVYNYSKHQDMQASVLCSLSSYNG
jgi:hypothetical protein